MLYRATTNLYKNNKRNTLVEMCHFLNNILVYASKYCAVATMSTTNFDKEMMRRIVRTEIDYRHSSLSTDEKIEILLGECKYLLGQPTSYVVTCQVCGKTAKNIQSLRNHKSKYHRREKPKAADETQSE